MKAGAENLGSLLTRLEESSCLEAVDLGKEEHNRTLLAWHLMSATQQETRASLPDLALGSCFPRRSYLN